MRVKVCRAAPPTKIVTHLERARTRCRPERDVVVTCARTRACVKQHTHTHTHTHRTVTLPLGESPPPSRTRRRRPLVGDVVPQRVVVTGNRLDAVVVADVEVIINNAVVDVDVDAIIKNAIVDVEVIINNAVVVATAANVVRLVRLGRRRRRRAALDVATRAVAAAARYVFVDLLGKFRRQLDSISVAPVGRSVGRSVGRLVGAATHLLT